MNKENFVYVVIFTFVVAFAHWLSVVDAGHRRSLRLARRAHRLGWSFAPGNVIDHDALPFSLFVGRRGRARAA